MSKKTIYIIVGGAVVLIVALIAHFKGGNYRKKDQGIEIETASKYDNNRRNSIGYRKNPT
jgi:HlyD family secretion protein